MLIYKKCLVEKFQMKYLIMKQVSTAKHYRYEWRRTVSGSYPTVSSFYKGTESRESTQSFISDHQISGRHKRGIRYYIRSGSHNSNKSKEMYVFSSRHKHKQNLDDEELSL